MTRFSYIVTVLAPTKVDSHFRQELQSIRTRAIANLRLMKNDLQHFVSTLHDRMLNGSLVNHGNFISNFVCCKYRR